ncbi:MAG: DUF928 domain-containing protein [Kiloniellaceae bacterium]
MTVSRVLLVAAAGLVLTTLAARMDGSPSTPGMAAWAANEVEKRPEVKKPVYLPPLRGAPTRRIGGATRGIGDEGIFVTVLAPESTGLTSRESPTLYWYVSRAPTRQVEFALIRDDWIEPVAEVTLGRPAAGGIAGVSLSELGVRLEPGVLYEWSIALVKNPLSRSTDIVTSATLLLRAPDGGLKARLERADAEDRFALYGRAGYWYDAIELASSAASGGAASAKWRAWRASFLDQVGLQRVAAFDRSP